MHPKQVISICGDSAVGKQTLIDAIACGDKDISDRFAISESFSIHATRHETRVAKTQLQSLQEMYYPPFSETIIYRWQFRGDAEIEKLLECFPQLRHRVILIWRRWSVHARDYVRVHRRNTPAGAEEMLRKNWNKFYRRFGPGGELQTRGVEVELVEGIPPTYPLITEWNRLERNGRVL